jgi:hypothetical protein
MIYGIPLLTIHISTLHVLHHRLPLKDNQQCEVQLSQLVLSFSRRARLPSLIKDTDTLPS